MICLLDSSEAVVLIPRKATNFGTPGYETNSDDYLYLAQRNACFVSHEMISDDIVKVVFPRFQSEAL